MLVEIKSVLLAISDEVKTRLERETSGRLFLLKLEEVVVERLLGDAHFLCSCLEGDSMFAVEPAPCTDFDDYFADFSLFFTALPLSFVV